MTETQSCTFLLMTMLLPQHAGVNPVGLHKTSCAFGCVLWTIWIFIDFLDCVHRPKLPIIDSQDSMHSLDNLDRHQMAPVAH